jgi:hypothetical protein
MQQVYNDKNLPYKQTDVFPKPLKGDNIVTDCEDFVENNNNIFYENDF